MLIQYILILVAPALLAASIYMEFGRIILVTNGENYTIIRRTWLTKIFVCGDIISFVVQFGGMLQDLLAPKCFSNIIFFTIQAPACSPTHPPPPLAQT